MLLEQGHLAIIDSAGPHVLGAQDVAVRLNNWDRVRIQRLPVLLMYAAVLGAGLIALVLVATGRLAYREERAPVDG